MPFLRIALSLVLGLMLGLSNLYIALRIGFTMGVAIITVFLWAGMDWVFRQIWAGWQPLSTQEYVCYQSLTSAMSYGCGTVIATALAALAMTWQEAPPVWVLTLWLSAICGLGTLTAVPLRNRMLARFPFPSGEAAAESVRRLGGGVSQRLFFPSLLAGWCWVGMRDGFGWVWGSLRFWPGKGWAAVQLSPLLIGLGAILGQRICHSMLAGGVLGLLIAPLIWSGTDNIDQLVLWFCIAALVTANLVEFASALTPQRTRAAIHTDRAGKAYWGWFIVLALVVWATSVVGLGASIWLTLMALVLVTLFSYLACRVTGETDVVPTGALGKLSLLIFGFMSPGGAAMTATGVLAGTSAASADFMTDLRCGSRLNCPLKRQLPYQLCGALVGPLIFVPIFMFLIGERIVLGSESFPAPAAQIWLNVLALTKLGWTGIDVTMRLVVVGGAVFGVVYQILAIWMGNPRWLPALIPGCVAPLLDVSTLVTLSVGAILAAKCPRSGSFPVWVALIAAESSAMVVLLVLL